MSLEDKIRPRLAYAFVSDNGKGGNPAGVVLEGNRLTDPQKQQIATDLGYSETAFWTPGFGKAARLQFFTPTKAIPFCGHATVATYGILKKETGLSDGVYPVEMGGSTSQVKLQQDWISLEQTVRSVTELAQEEIPAVLASLGVPGVTAFKRPVLVDNGVRFLIVPFEKGGALKTLKVDFAQVSAFSKRFDLVGYYCLEPGQGGFHAEARMFAPFYGIDEESATGMGGGAAAVWLFQQGRGKSLRILQGAAMQPPCPSEIRTEIESSETGPLRLWVGGRVRI